MGEANRRAEIDEFIDAFEKADTAARELMIELKDANLNHWNTWRLRIHTAISELLQAEQLAKDIQKWKKVPDEIHRGCAILALREAALVLLRIKFVAVQGDTALVIEELRQARSALLLADAALDLLSRHPIRRRLAATYRGMFLGKKSVGFEDVRNAYDETQRAVNAIYLNIIIAIAASKSHHKSLSSILGATMEDVVNHVETGHPIDHARLSDFARLIFVLINTRVILLAYGISRETAICRAYLHVLEGHVNYCAARISIKVSRRRKFAHRATGSIRSSRASERKSIELFFTYPLRKMAKTDSNHARPMADWVTNIPRYSRRRKLRQVVARKLRRFEG
jgi:hypothetical protein